MTIDNNRLIMWLEKQLRTRFGEWGETMHDKYIRRYREEKMNRIARGAAWEVDKLHDETKRHRGRKGPKPADSWAWWT